MTPFLFAFAIWCDRASISRSDYAALLEVIQLARNTPEVWMQVPNTLDTLQNRYQAQLPTPPIYEKQIDLRLDKLPTGQSGAGKVYYFDPVELTKTILRSDLRRHMHFGMAQLVEKASELWHGDAWAESIRTCSGEFAIYPDGTPVFPSDFVTYREANLLHIGRVRGVYQDMRTPTNSAKPILRFVDLDDDIKPLVAHPPPGPGECLLIEDTKLISANQIIARLGQNVSFDRDFRDDEDLAEEAQLRDSQEAAREGARSMRQAARIRAVRLTHPIRAELELKTYGREVLIRDFVSRAGSRPIRCMPQMTFIDGFGLYRNMYRSLTGVYMIPSNLPIRERTRLVNVFPLTLGPHGSELRDVLGCLEAPSKELESGIIMQVPYGESHVLVEALVSSFALGYLGDMPQQNECAGFLRQNAAFGCRSCTIPSKEYGNLDYDIDKRGRYHNLTLDIRAKASDMAPTRGKALLRNMGINELPSPVLTILSPAIDVCRSFPPDPPHAEMSGIARLLQDLLIDHLLLPNQRDAYASAFRKQALPPGWGRVQNPLRHRSSWDLSEQSRACVITALVLRTWLTNQRLQPAILRAIRAEFGSELGEFGSELGAELRLLECDIVTMVYSQLASSYTLITSHYMSVDDAQNMSSATLLARRLFLRLINCAISAGTRGRGGRGGRASSRASSIATSINEDDISDVEEEPSSQLGDASAQIPSTSPNVLKKWLNRPNIHVSMHYYAYCKQYATLWNANVLIGEKYHRLFKIHVTHTNHKNVELHLLMHESRKKAVRFAIDGAFDATNPTISGLFRAVASSCPTLLERLLPASNRCFLEPNETGNLSSDSANHINPRVSGRLPAIYLDKAGLPTKSLRQIAFDLDLRMAYDRDYGRRNVHVLGAKSFIYYQRFTSVDQKEEKRIGYTAGTYITLKPPNSDSALAPIIGRIEYIFTHQLRQITRLFVYVELLEDSGQNDHITSMRVLRATGRRVIYGLPTVDPQRLYIIPRLGARAQAGGVLAEDDDMLFWWCQWDVRFC
ncbi:hypothetical protein DFP73DRAFT_482296 [Morchella snyderi]|nr:hypothetical protein DFP73DRAFT_482296 [Morchella snyderi]